MQPATNLRSQSDASLRNWIDTIGSDGPMVDPAFLKERYPAAYEAFDAWMKANALERAVQATGNRL